LNQRWWSQDLSCDPWSYIFFKFYLFFHFCSSPNPCYFPNPPNPHHKSWIPSHPTSIWYQNQIFCFFLPQNPLKKKLYCSMNSKFIVLWTVTLLFTVTVHAALFIAERSRCPESISDSFRVRFEFRLKRWMCDWVPNLLERFHSS